MKKDKKLFVGVGVSQKGTTSPEEAASEAISTALKELKKRGGDKPKLGLLACSTIFDGEKIGEEVDKQLKEINPDIKWVGATSPSTISNFGIRGNSCLIALIESEYINFSVGVSKGIYENSVKAGEKSAESAIQNLEIDSDVDPYIYYLAMKKKKTKKPITNSFALVFSSGVRMDKTPHEEGVVKGLVNALGPRVPLIGGAAGSEIMTENNYVFHNGEAISDGVITTLFSVDLRTEFDFFHGFEKTDKGAFVTKVKEGDEYVVLELNNKPAAQVYAKMLGMSLDKLWPSKLNTLFKYKGFLKHLGEVANKMGIAEINMEKYFDMVPLFYHATKNPCGVTDVSDNVYVKVPIEVTKEKGLRFTHPIPKNTYLKLLKLDENKFVKKETKFLKEFMKTRPEILLDFSCGLKRLLYMKTDTLKKLSKNIQKICKKKGVQMFGFFSMAEYISSEKSRPSSTAASSSLLGIHDKLLSDKG